MDVSKEIMFQTTRSGGKGGQNVNKVETAVIASFNIEASRVLTDAQKEILKEKMMKNIQANGFIQVKSQTYRTQLDNKADAVRKINVLLTRALQRKKARIATRVSKAVVAQRIDTKKRKGMIKQDRKKISRNDY